MQYLVGFRFDQHLRTAKAQSFAMNGLSFSNYYNNPTSGLSKSVGFYEFVIGYQSLTICNSCEIDTWFQLLNINSYLT